MPNYLDEAISAGGFAQGITMDIKFPEDNFDNVENEDVEAEKIPSYGNSLPNYSQILGGLGIGMGGGSKPEALHTEYAGETDSNRAYGTQDVVFYLQRTGGSGGDGGGDGGGGGGERFGDLGDTGFVWDESSSSLVPIGTGRTGAAPENGQLQSGLNQIAMGEVGIGKSRGGPMAPIGGFSIDDEIDLGEITQNASKDSDISEILINVTRRVKELSESTEKFSLGSAEVLFSKIINANFDPEFEVFGTRTESQILDTLNRPARSELAFLLARAAGRRIRGKDIVRAINDGEIGLTTLKSRAFQSRISNPGRTPR